MSIADRIFIEGLLAVASEDIRAQTIDLTTKLMKLISEYPKPVIALTLLRINMEVGEMAHSELERIIYDRKQPAPPKPVTSGMH
jgi:hypothetical protein